MSREHRNLSIAGIAALASVACIALIIFAALSDLSI
jgi:hypothetical protein